MPIIKKMGLYLKKQYISIVMKLVSLSGSTRRISKGFATGAAMSFTPFVGFHLMFSYIIAKLFKQNTIASVIGTSVGNPWTFPVIWFSILKLGYLILGTENYPEKKINLKDFFSGLYQSIVMLDYDVFMSEVWPIFLPMLVGCIPFYIISWWFFYYLMRRVLLDAKKMKD